MFLFFSDEQDMIDYNAEFYFIDTHIALWINYEIFNFGAGIGYLFIYLKITARITLTSLHFSPSNISNSYSTKYQITAQCYLLCSWLP